MHFEVVVAGGGPAGLAAAIALQQSGFMCAVFDGQQPPLDKACGEGLMPDALEALAALGITLQEADGFPIQGIRFCDAANSAEARFSQGQGLGVRRTHLAHRMVERAAALGVQFFWKTPLSFRAGALLLHGKESIAYDWLVIADGQTSTLAQGAGFAPARAGSVRLAARQHYAVQPWTSSVEVYWGAHTQVYVTPVSANCIGVAVLCRTWPKRVEVSKIESALAEFPALAERLRGAVVSSRMRGSITSNRRLPRVARQRTVLIGDASGSVDAITGEGLAIAFRQALLLSRALKAGNLGMYEHGHRQLATMPHRMARVLLTLDRWPDFRGAAVAALARRPEIFRGLLDLHTGTGSLAHFGWQHGIDLTWELVRSTRRHNRRALFTGA